MSGGSDGKADSEDKTEYVSEKRTRQAWEEGKIPLGRDLPLWAGLAGGTAALTAGAPLIRDLLTRTMTDAISGAGRARHEWVAMPWGRPLLAAFAICAGAAVAATIATVAQTRGGMWANLAAPDLSRLIEGSPLKRWMKKEFWVDLGISLVKVGGLALVVYSTLGGEFMTLPKLLGTGPLEQLQFTSVTLKRLAVNALALLAVFSGLDFALSQLRFRENMKMTKDEAKREAKEDEGDPLVRSRRRRKHRELSKGRAAVEVPRADVLLVNPTHIAIAIRYRKDEARAPRVMAKGKGALAEMMRDLARQNGIAIVQDIALARLLYKKVKVGRQVPSETYRAVAAVLAFVYRLTGKSGAGAPVGTEAQR